MTVVLDASAVLAVMLEEKGKDKVIPHLTDSLISAINIAEIVSCLTRREIPIQMIEKALAKLPIIVQPFTLDLALKAGALIKDTRMLGLSLADRACLAVGIAEGKPVLTADRAWSKLTLDIEIRVFR